MLLLHSNLMEESRPFRQFEQYLADCSIWQWLAFLGPTCTRGRVLINICGVTRRRASLIPRRLYGPVQ